jgi:hypothetical protein
LVVMPSSVLVVVTVAVGLLLQLLVLL